MLEFIVEFIIEYIFSYPGGFIRWLIFRKKSLKVYVNDGIFYNSAVFVAFVLLIGILVYFFEKYMIQLR